MFACLSWSLFFPNYGHCAAAFDPARISRTAFDANLDGRCVFYDFPSSGIRFDLFWMDQDKVIWSMPFASAKGWHGYDPRAHPEWKGQALAVFINYPGVRGNLAVPGLWRELAMFTKPQQALTYTVNTLDGNTIMGMNTVLVLSALSLALCLILFLAAFILFRKRLSLQACLLAGFIPVLAVMGALSWFGVADTLARLDDNAYLKDIKNFSALVARESAKMGNSTWAYHELPWPYDNQIRYLMADKLKMDTAQARTVFVFENGEFRAWSRGK